MFLNNTSYATIIKTATIDFTRTIRQRDTEETIEGTFYYRSPKRILASIKKPINQWMSFENNTVLIYYPEDSVAFKLISPYKVSFSFFESFLNAMKDDFGVCDRGYSLEHHETKNDTLITYWNPPQILSKTIGQLKLTHMKNKITASELTNKSGNPLLKATFNNHFNYGTYYFPQEINTVLFTEEDTIFEKITYKNAIFNNYIPKEIANFKIPEGIEIEEIHW